MPTVEPLGKAAFELFDKDRNVIHAPAIRFQQSVDVLNSIGPLGKAREPLLERLNTFRTVAGFDTRKHFALRQRHRLRHFAQQMEMVGHQNVGQHPNTAESFQRAHQREKLLGLRSPKDKAALNNS